MASSPSTRRFSIHSRSAAKYSLARGKGAKTLGPPPSPTRRARPCRRPMLGIPGTQPVRVRRPEAEAADPAHAHDAPLRQANGRAIGTPSTQSSPRYWTSRARSRAIPQSRVTTGRSRPPVMSLRSTVQRIPPFDDEHPARLEEPMVIPAVFRDQLDTAPAAPEANVVAVLQRGLCDLDREDRLVRWRPARWRGRRRVVWGCRARSRTAFTECVRVVRGQGCARWPDRRADSVAGAYHSGRVHGGLVRPPRRAGIGGRLRGVSARASGIRRRTLSAVAGAAPNPSSPTTSASARANPAEQRLALVAANSRKRWHGGFPSLPRADPSPVRPSPTSRCSRAGQGGQHKRTSAANPKRTWGPTSRLGPCQHGAGIPIPEPPRRNRLGAVSFFTKSALIRGHVTSRDQGGPSCGAVAPDGAPATDH